MQIETIISLLTLVALEVILGIDNIIFISIMANKLPLDQQKKARRLGIVLATIMRLGLLALVTWIMKLNNDLFTVFDQGISGKDLVLITGGLFLLYKSTKEIYHKMEGAEGDQSVKIKAITFTQVLLQILLLDMVFSVDSIITAVGMVKEVWVMYTAVIVTVILMLFVAEPISKFVNNHPAFKMLALCFLLIIGMALLAEGFEVVIPKGYIYFSMAFCLLVDILQMRMNKKASPIKVNEHYTKDEGELPKNVL